MADVPLIKLDTTATSGEVPTADGAGSYTWATPAGGGGGSAALVVESYLSAAQSIPHNTETAILYDTDAYDPDGWHDNVTNKSRFTVPTGADGDYRADVLWAGASSTDYWQAVVYKNGVSTGWGEFGTMAGSFGLFLSVPLRGLVATDYIEVKVQQTSGGAMNALANFNRVAVYHAS